jgi:hypothetical protein
VPGDAAERTTAVVERQGNSQRPLIPQRPLVHVHPSVAASMYLRQRQREALAAVLQAEKGLEQKQQDTERSRRELQRLRMDRSVKEQSVNANVAGGPEGPVAASSSRAASAGTTHPQLMARFSRHPSPLLHDSGHSIPIEGGGAVRVGHTDRTGAMVRAMSFPVPLPQIFPHQNQNSPCHKLGPASSGLEPCGVAQEAPSRHQLLTAPTQSPLPAPKAPAVVPRFKCTIG